MLRANKFQIAAIALLAVPFLATVPIACIEDEEPADDAAADSDIELRSGGPGKGTGSASWTVSHSAGSVTFSISMTDGVASVPTITGTLPPFQDLPLSAQNASGEDLYIETVTIAGSRYRKYSGWFKVEIDSDDSANGCTYCTCQLNAGPPCMSALTYSDCSSPGDGTCTQWTCGTSGGGVAKIDVDFTSIPGT